MPTTKTKVTMQDLSKLARRPEDLINPKLALAAPEPDQIGSVAWAAEMVFGGQEQFENMFMSLVSVIKMGGMQKWRRVARLIQHLRDSGQSYNLNQVCVTMDVDGRELLQFVGKGVRELAQVIVTTKASVAAIELFDITHAAARDIEKGGKDRDVVYGMAGVAAEKGGLTINNSNQQTVVKIGKEELLAPLRQFAGLAESIDDAVRGNVVEGELIDESTES